MPSTDRIKPRIRYSWEHHAFVPSYRTRYVPADQLRACRVLNHKLNPDLILFQQPLPELLDARDMGQYPSQQPDFQGAGWRQGETLCMKIERLLGFR